MKGTDYQNPGPANPPPTIPAKSLHLPNEDSGKSINPGTPIRSAAFC